MPGAASSLMLLSEALTCSCILACSSWLRSLERSDSFCCNAIALRSTACFACAAAVSD